MGSLLPCRALACAAAVPTERKEAVLMERKEARSKGCWIQFELVGVEMPLFGTWQHWWKGFNSYIP